MKSRSGRSFEGSKSGGKCVGTSGASQASGRLEFTPEGKKERTKERRIGVAYYNERRTLWFDARKGERDKAQGGRIVEECFVTGTFAGLIPVRSVDGRTIGPTGEGVGPVTARLQRLYGQLMEDYASVGRRDLSGKRPEQLLV